VIGASSPEDGGHARFPESSAAPVFDPQVTAIAAQPFWLRWRDDAGRSRRHAPDLFAQLTDGSAVVIDVRPDDRIEPRDTESFDAIRKACELAGWASGG
jgi:hypothetical protein